MHYPEFDALCHEVAGKLSELRRLTMETAVLTDDQEALLAELTRLLRLTDAASSQQIHSLLGDTTTPDSAFLAELRDELPLLASPAGSISPGSFLATPSSPVAPPSQEEGPGEMPASLPNEERVVTRNGGEMDSGERATMREIPVPSGLLEEIYWDIRPVYPKDNRLLFAHDADWKFCLIVTDETGQTALLFDTDEARAAYLREVYREALDRPKPEDSKGEEESGDEDPDAPVPAPLLPRTPVLAGGNARRLEDAVAESESGGGSAAPTTVAAWRRNGLD
ncbi:hypothetical protein [Armatimonas sp.]|uniref:hypothetical protein n=1 Tax=Armatimonas sp. TaxID=1872638 RepID=UPI00375217A7